MVVRPRSRRLAATAATAALVATALGVLPGSAAAAPTPLPIAAIQGTAKFSPYRGVLVTTTPSQVTAVYPTGGLAGFVIQTPGTGGKGRDLRRASDAVFVYTGTASTVALGDLVSVTGTVTEYPSPSTSDDESLTEIGGKVTVTTSTARYRPVTPVSGVRWAKTAGHRENLESMLYADPERFTVTDSHSLGDFGTLGLAAGSTQLVQPTDAAAYGSKKAAAVAADNAARGVVLDDGSNTRFALPEAKAPGTPPYLTRKRDVRLGDTVHLTEPVIVDYRFGAWTLNPTRPTAAGDEVARLTGKAREAVPAVKGDVSVASFNVLNYFSTLGSTTKGCTAGTTGTDGPNTTSGCDVRGAWDAADLGRQQTKIVKAINGLDASVVGLLEIENSARLGEPVDEATKTLVAALNAAAGRTKWAYVPSRTDQLEPTADQDVITNAIIFQAAEVRWSGKSYADGKDAAKGGAFDNARTPVGASFVPVGGGEPVLVVVNHLKSKGSGPTDPADPNADHGQGAWNASRVAQAKALLGWLPVVSSDAGTASVALVGDFNSYTHEDPLEVLYRAGYANAARQSDYSYSFDGLGGSLDHVLLSPAAAKRKTGSGVWNINSPEPELRQYSEYKTTALDYYVDDLYRSSDHDPVVVGLKRGKATQAQLTLLEFNDFHGRVAKTSPDTVKFFGTIEEQRAAAGEENTLLLSAGDNIGASLFTSAVQEDQPTIDVLNAADLDVSAVGNHEFDRGFADLTGRVDRAADWTYLGANVYKKGTTTPALPAYQVFTRDGVRIGVIGAVTQETASLVSPAGITGVDFGDPVDAVNRVAKQLTDGKKANGEADVLVAEYHEGAPAGEAIPPVTTSSTLEEQVRTSPVFAKIVQQTSPKVAVLFTGHTHQKYAWDGPVPGSTTATRPVLQTSSYAAFLGKVTLTVDLKSKKVTAYTRENLAPTATDDAALVARFPRVAAVSAVVDAAVAKADALGQVTIGESTGRIARAAGATGSEDRGAESPLSNLVAEMYRQSLAPADRGAAQIGVQNPGGVRADLPAGVLRYQDAAAVLPFANSLFTADLTGAQVKTLLEQQWQRNEDGTVPSRAYLQLGLSDNVTYTFDAARPEGDRVTSIAVDGKPVGATTTYRVATNSFLAAGGDNFRVFRDGANRRDTGLNDLEAWTDWIKAHTPVSPSYAKHAVGVSPLPSPLAAGSTTTVSLSNLDFTTVGGGDPDTTTVTATLGGVAVGTATVADGKATLSVAVPAGTAPGAALLVLKTDSRTTVTIPVIVT